MNRVSIRSWTPDDVGLVLHFVRALAAYEREPDAVSASEADLLRDGFGAKPCFEVRLAFVDDRPAGFTLFFTTYSTWEGRPGLYLEDIFVDEWARKCGVGRRLIIDLAQLAQARNCRRLDLSVLDWNPARGFYERLSIHPNKGWLPYRIRGDALARLAAESES